MEIELREMLEETAGDLAKEGKILESLDLLLRVACVKK